MKLLHLADLHIGKRVNEFSMIADQKYIFNQILHIVRTETPDGVLICGDVYDKSQPSAEAVELFDAFLTDLAACAQPVFIISGNHDSPERLGFGSRLLQSNGLHIAGVFDGTLPKVTLQDSYGAVHIHLLPFLKPTMARPFFEQPIETYDDAIGAVLSAACIDAEARNVLLAHQFVVAGGRMPEQSESEVISIGGLDHVTASLFDAFDYVALGHLHGPQKIGRDTVRYAGSPLKYSFSEARHRKSAALIELCEKGTVTVQLLPLTPVHDLREIKGPIAALLEIGRNDPAADDYIHATLTDEDEIYDAIGQMRQVYPNLMLLDFENTRSRQTISSRTAASGEVSSKSPFMLFSDFYTLQNGSELTPQQQKMLTHTLEQAGGDAL